MSRTDMDAATLARSLRRMAGDGGMEWCCEPIRASVLLDVADLLDEGVKLRGLVTCYLISAPQYGEDCQECSACGEVLDGYLFDGGHCPRCGAKVVDG